MNHRQLKFRPMIPLEGRFPSFKYRGNEENLRNNRNRNYFSKFMVAFIKDSCSIDLRFVPFLFSSVTLCNDSHNKEFSLLLIENESLFTRLINTQVFSSFTSCINFEVRYWSSLHEFVVYENITG